MWTNTNISVEAWITMWGALRSAEFVDLRNLVHNGMVAP